jgi:gliding motility-associated-like protein
MVIGKDANNCFSDTGYVNLVIAPTPLVNAGPDVQAPTGTQVQLNASVQSTQAVSWNWTPSAGLSCTACPNPKAIITANKTYVVSVQNASGCMSKDTLNVISFCKGAEIFVANAFTPDGDGVNDVLVVRGVGITVRSFKVFNRWGNLVFEKRMIRANDYKNGWDGRVKGVLAAPDVYVYTVEVVCDNGDVFFHKGNTTLLK